MKWGHQKRCGSVKCLGVAQGWGGGGGGGCVLVNITTKSPLQSFQELDKCLLFSNRALLMFQPDHQKPRH